MEKGFNSWSQEPQINWQSLNPNLSSAQFGLRPQVICPSFGNMTSPPFCDEPRGWFYGMPRYRQSYVPIVDSVVKEVEKKLPEASSDVPQKTNGLQKKFLVFDQSGDQTTLMYSLGVGPSSTYYQLPSNNNPKPQFGSHMVCVDTLIKKDEGNDSKSDMREDSEDLNALLYSDDDDYDDDETSTGHSPGLMMGFPGQKRKIRSDEEEEVASSGGPLKRHKKDDKGGLVNTIEDNASSVQPGINCSGNGMFEEDYDNLSSGDKKLRIEKMKETINVLQNLIPGDTNGKNAIMVIDEAIHYLRSLKEKAKALELDYI